MNTASTPSAGSDDASALSRLPASLGSAIANVGSSILAGMVSFGEANPRLREFERLSGLSDAELGARGLNRDHLVEHVFRGSSFI